MRCFIFVVSVTRTKRLAETALKFGISTILLTVNPSLTNGFVLPFDRQTWNGPLYIEGSQDKTVFHFLKKQPV